MAIHISSTPAPVVQPRALLRPAAETGPLLLPLFELEVRHSNAEVCAYSGENPLPPIAPLPSLTDALFRRRTIFGATEVAAPAWAVAAITGNSHISAETNAEFSGIAQPDPDAELIALGREWQASAERCTLADKALDEAALRTRDIEPPQALFLRPTDGWHFRWFAKGQHDDRGRWYAPGAVEKLRTYDFVNPCGDRCRDGARRDEIVAAHDAWAAEIAAMEEAAGFTAAEAESEAAHDENRTLRGRIQMAEADTMAGVMTKARIAGWCWRHSDDMRERVADDLKERNTSGEAMSFSLAADLVAMLERETA